MRKLPKTQLVLHERVQAVCSCKCLRGMKRAASHFLPPPPTFSFHIAGCLGPAKGCSWTVRESGRWRTLKLPKTTSLGLLGSMLMVCTMASAFRRSAHHHLKSQPQKTWVLRRQPAPPQVHTSGDRPTLVEQPCALTSEVEKSMGQVR